MHKRTAGWGNQSYLISPVLRKASATILVLFLIGSIVTTPVVDGGETNDFIVYVSNERSGNVTALNGATDTVITTIGVGKRPRGIHCSPDGSLVYVALSGSPRMGPGVDRSRAIADRSADGIGVIDARTKKFLRKLPAGSDPEQFALTRDGAHAVISNEDRAFSAVLTKATASSASWAALCSFTPRVVIKHGHKDVGENDHEQERAGDLFHQREQNVASHTNLQTMNLELLLTGMR